MKRIITLALLGITLTTGAALADRDRGHRNNDRRHDRVEHRDRGGRDRVVHRDRGRWDRGRDRVIIRDRDRHRHVHRSRPVYRNNTFYFDGGVTRVYRAPTVRYRYRNYYQRPTVLVENYDPMPGYVWVQGNWNWNGYEWVWMPGHYEVDANYGVSFSASW
jgi:hypothetical protein